MSAHHGDNPFEDEDSAQRRNELMRKLLDTTGFIGETAAFPAGKLNKDDEGELRFAIKPENGKIVVDFGKPVAWIGLTPQQACDLASHIIKVARATARQNGETVGFTIL